MKARTPIKRISLKKLSSLEGKYVGSTITGKRKAIKKKARTKSERERIYGPPGRTAFVRSLGCVVCTVVSPFFGLASAGKSHNAHTVTGGTGRKADYTTIVPLCYSHHRRYDEFLPPCDDPVVRDAVKGAAFEVERRWLEHTEATK